MTGEKDRGHKVTALDGRDSFAILQVRAKRPSGRDAIGSCGSQMAGGVVGT